MSFFVTITFDLNYAEPSAYSTVKNEFDNIDFSKYLTGKKKKVKLPANTYVAEFDENDFSKSKELRNYVVGEVEKIFTKYHLSGKYFINVGRKWAWKIGNVK